MSTTLQRGAPARPPKPGSSRQRKPLYLVTDSAIRVAARGASLLVQRQPRGEQCFPINRLSRIVCNHNADWSGQAVALCLSHGITLTWVAGNGDPLGDCTARLTEPAPFDTMIERYLELSDWPDRHGNWLRRARMEVLLRAARDRDAAGAPYTAQEFSAYKRNYVYRGELPASYAAAWLGWLHALTVARLHRDKLHAHYWGEGGTTLDLAEDLTGLLWAELNLSGGTLAAGEDATHPMTMLFESAAQRYEQRLLRHLASLNRHVNREVAAWPCT